VVRGGDAGVEGGPGGLHPQSTWGWGRPEPSSGEPMRHAGEAVAAGERLIEAAMKPGTRPRPRIGTVTGVARRLSLIEVPSSHPRQQLRRPPRTLTPREHIQAAAGIWVVEPAVRSKLGIGSSACRIDVGLALRAQEVGNAPLRPTNGHLKRTPVVDSCEEVRAPGLRRLKPVLVTSKCTHGLIPRD
jgi:hypothetical protein